MNDLYEMMTMITLRGILEVVDLPIAQTVHMTDAGLEYRNKST
jgi:hypothetical protein